VERVSDLGGQTEQIVHVYTVYERSRVLSLLRRIMADVVSRASSWHMRSNRPLDTKHTPIALTLY
jgi:hypothetical protein